MLPVCCQRCELSTLAPITKPGACCHPWSDGDGLLALWSCKPKVNLFCKLSWLWCLSQQQESNQYTNLLNTFRKFWKSVSLHCPGKSGTYDYPVLISGVAEVRGLWLQTWLIKFYLCEIVLCGSNLIISSQYWLSSMTDCFCDVMLNCLMISVVLWWKSCLAWTEIIPWHWFCSCFLLGISGTLQVTWDRPVFCFRTKRTKQLPWSPREGRVVLTVVRAGSGKKLSG